MSKTSVLSTLWNSLRGKIGVPIQETHFIGTDKLGNKYYERIADSKHRAARWYETQHGVSNSMDYRIDKAPDVPNEWDGWLRGSRKGPPTQEEIEQNQMRSATAVARAMKLESKAAVEKERSGNSIEQSAEFYKRSRPDIKQSSTNFPEYEDLESNPGHQKRKK